MEIKATLQKPHTDIKRADFIVTQCHINGYILKETDTELQAWGKTQAEIFEQKKAYKYIENQNCLDEARVNHIFTVILQGYECTFDTKDKTQADLNSAMLSANAGYPWKWTTNNKIKIDLQVEDIIIITNSFQSLVNDDIDKWTYYETKIDEATTLEELEEIVINYDLKLKGDNNDIIEQDLSALDSGE